MKSLFIVCAAVACTIAAPACMSGDGGPPTSPIDPFGTEPAPTTGSEPTGSGGQATIADLCVQVCARITSACGDGTESGSCASECAADAPPQCQPEFRVFLECLATAMLNCSGFIAPACEGALIAAQNCENSQATRQ
jgi:hypothetical protein